mgnify:CR=1 FL=1|jgi:hypothetical protein
MACKDKNCVCNENRKQKMDIIDQIKKDRNNRLDELKETIAEYNPEALLADGHDHAIMGYSTDGRVIYSINMVIEGLIEDSEMTYEDAVEFFNFNIGGAYVGEYTPIFMHED